MAASAARLSRFVASCGPVQCRPKYLGHPFRLFATSIRPRDKRDSRPPKVSWYRQLYPGARDKEQLEDGEEDEEVSGAARELRKRITELEEELGELRGDRSQSLGAQGSLIVPLLEQLSDEDREKVRLALQQAELTDAERAEVEAESEALTNKAVGRLAGGLGADILREAELGDLEVALDLEPQQTAHLRRFNTCLRNAAKDTTDSKVRKNLWVSYERCKRLLPSFGQHVPDQSWDVLWESQNRNLSGLRDHRDQASRLSVLAQDILRSGKELSAQQRATIIDTLMNEGRLDEAQAHWDLQSHSDHGLAAKGHGLQGMRLSILRGNIDKAQEIAESLCEDADPDTARCFLLLIEAWVKSGKANSIRNAWDAYLKLRETLGSNIDISDFDKAAMCFINAGRTDVALAIFKDMMLTGRELECGSGQLYKTSLTLLGLLQSRSASSSEVSNVSLSALTTLPRTFQNKFFYGSWIKKLIGLGEIDGAVSVIELMYERGVKPDAKHVNGIIGAWLRSGQPANKAKAEQLGWAMIQQRIKAVKERKGHYSDLTTGAHVRIPPQLQRVVPPATIETFSLLLLYYGRRSNSDAVHALKKHLDHAEISPNSYFMNHMLYAELRRGQHHSAWEIYQRMKASVKPDLETFACLWDCEKAHLDKLPMHPMDEFPGPRKIFSSLMEWYAGLGTRNQVAVCQEFSEELYNQIIRCMCLAKDVEGTLIALYGLQKSFNFLPNDETLRMIPMQVARIGLEEPQMTRKRRRSRLSDLAGSRTRIANVSKVFDLVVEQRIEALNRDGIKLEECSSERQNEEQIHILAEFLRVVMRRYARDEQSMNEAIRTAAGEMGVSGITFGDSSPST
ncbi:MAG: hypothetical protein Q9196_003374 [Gyalolechia fulgens]